MSHKIILAVSLTLATLLTTVPSSSADSKLIITTCQKIAQVEPVLGGNYQTCVDFLNSDPSSARSSLEGLAEISFGLTQKKAASIRSLIGAIIADPRVSDPDMKLVLRGCGSLYDDGKGKMVKALAALKSKDYPGARIFTTEASEAPVDCQNGLKGKTSPVTPENTQIEKYYAIDLGFVKLLSPN